MLDANGRELKVVYDWNFILDMMCEVDLVEINLVDGKNVTPGYFIWKPMMLNRDDEYGVPYLVCESQLRTMARDGVLRAHMSHGPDPIVTYYKRRKRDRDRKLRPPLPAPSEELDEELIGV